MNIAQALGELDLRPGATEQEVRSAYRTLVAKWHPDKHQNDPIRLREAELRIKNINRAFEALQKAGFRTEKPSGKGGQKAEKPKGRSQSKSPEPPEVPKDGRSEQKAQKQPDGKPVKGHMEKQRWPIELLVGAMVLFLTGFLLGRSLDSGDQNLRQVGEGGQGVDVLEQQEEINDDRNKLAKENTAMHEKIVNLELPVSDLEATLSDLEKSELEETGHQKKLAYAKAFIEEAAVQDGVMILGDMLKTLADEQKKQLLTQAIPPGNTALSRDIAEIYFSRIGADQQNAVLKDFYADRLGFSATGIRDILLGEVDGDKKATWDFYWDGLLWTGANKSGTVPFTSKKVIVREFPHRFNDDGELKWILPKGASRKQRETRDAHIGDGYSIELRWVLWLGDDSHLFPVVDVPEGKSDRRNPFGKMPRFRGLWQHVTHNFNDPNQHAFWDRAIGLKLVEDTFRQERKEDPCRHCGM
jgi:hypothetical protein